MSGTNSNQRASGNAPRSVSDPSLSGDATVMQMWTGASIEPNIQTSVVGQIYRRWQSINKSKLPRLCHFVSIQPALIDNLLIVARFNADDFVVAYQSSNRIRALGYDMRGSLLSEISTRHGDTLKAINNKCMISKVAIYTRFIVDDGNLSYREAICLPFAADDSGRPFFVLNGISEISAKIELLQKIYDQSPNGLIICIRQSEKAQNDITQARILNMNVKAEKILGQKGHISNLYCIADLGPWLRDVLRWTRISVQKARTKPNAFIKMKPVPSTN